MGAGNSPAEDVFSAAWQQVLRGRSIDAVLADYPEHAAELAPLLRLARQMHALSTPSLSPEALAAIQERMHAAPGAPALVGAAPGQPPARFPARASDTTLAPRHRLWFAPLFAPMQVSTGLLLLLVLVIASALVFAATQPGPERQPAMVAYSGTITRIDGTVWQVDDTAVLLDDATEIHGQPRVGATMRCVAVPLGADKLQAFEIWVRAAPGAPTVTPRGSQGPAPAADLPSAP